MCIVNISTPNNTTLDGLKNVLLKNYTKATIQLYKREALVSFEDEEGQRVISSIEPGNKVESVAAAAAPNKSQPRLGKYGACLDIQIKRNMGSSNDSPIVQMNQDIFGDEYIEYLEKEQMYDLLEHKELSVTVISLYIRNEQEAVKDIVKKVTGLLNKTDLFIANNPVGVRLRVRDMIQLLDIQQSNDVILLGMWGMGGIGKTTIAKAIYNQIGRSFNYRSFLANIREICEQNVGQVSLQQQLLFDTCKETKTKIQNIEAGKIILKDRLQNKRVLVVLDDVSTLDQLHALCGSRQWFGSGSKIIITTRDMQILKGDRVDQIYRMKEMDKSESVELFSWNAFKQAKPRKELAEFSLEVVEYSGGLPLALEVLGSYLFDRGIPEWKSVLDKLKLIPNDQVQKKLRISYDGLKEDTEKEIFLDIACFFIGMARNNVVHILNGCELYAEIGINILVERSLVTVDGKNKLGMHDLLRDMGREIIREKSPKDPEERSRLWFSKDVLNVLLEETGTKVIEGLTLKWSKTNVKCFSTKTFKEMKKLRLLQLTGVQPTDGDFEYLSKKLRWFSWNGFPLKYLPTSFYQENLVSIELEYSNIKFLWKESQRLDNLKILNLSHSYYLVQTPDFLNLPKLEQLILVDCPRLSQVSQSIGHLNEIVLINFQDCTSLRSLPRSIYKLKSLKTLILSGCSMIDKLEEDIEQMKSLTTLIANNTAIKRVPFSVVRSKSIGYISLCGYEGFARDVFPSIIRSWMSPTDNLSSQFKKSSIMSCLVPFNVAHSRSHELSSIFKYLPSLRSLWVECSSELQLSQDAAIILKALYALNYKDLKPTETTSKVSRNSLKSIFIQMGMNCQVANILKEKIEQVTLILPCMYFIVNIMFNLILILYSLVQNMLVNGRGRFLFPSNSYPNWLSFNCDGSSVIFEVPQVKGHNLKSLMCIVYSSTSDNITSDGLKNVLVKNYTKATIQLYKREALACFDNEEGQSVVSSIEPGNKVEVVVVFQNGFIVNKTIVYLVYDKPIGKNVELCHVIARNGDENECASKRKSTQDFNKNRKIGKQWLGKNQFLWWLQIFILATIVFYFLLKFLGILSLINNIC
uniref:NBS-LRR protein n=1 Tax=Cicer arietinum TaxID=3827 RepID=W0LWJ6_CICAR|nr:NBS-LRR protein [Cicer arietinum]